MDNICTTRKATGKPAPSASEFFVSLNKQEAKKPIPVKAKYSSNVLRFNNKNPLISSSLGKRFSLTSIPTIVTIPSNKVILISRKPAWVLAIFPLVLGVESK